MHNVSIRGHIPNLPKDGPSVSIHNNAVPSSLKPFPTFDLYLLSIAQFALKIRHTNIF